MTIEYQSLWKKYGAFASPSAEITVGGTDLISIESCVVTSLSVSLSCGKKAGMAVLHIEAEPEDTKLPSLLTAGESVVLKLGYKNEKSTVFFGYLHSASIIRTPEGVSYEAVCLDCKGLMSQEACSMRPDNKKLDAVIKDILTKSRYSAFYAKSQIGGMPKPFEDDTVQPAMSDRVFLENIAEKFGLFFFIRQDKLIFDKELQNADTVKLDYENGIVSSESRTDLTRQVKKVTFMSADEDGVSISATAKSRVSVKQAGDIKEVCDAGARTKEGLSALAEAMMKRIDDEAHTFCAKCIGLPELLPLNTVKTKSADWEIREAIHTFDDFGYHTEIKGVTL